MWLLLIQFRGILIIKILKSFRNISSNNFLFGKEILMVETEVNYYLLYRVVRTVAHRGHATFFFFFFFFFLSRDKIKISRDN